MSWKKISLVLLLTQSSAALASDKLDKQREQLFQELQNVHQLSDDQLAAVKRIFANSAVLSQGNPDVTKHPFTADECKAQLKKEKISYDNPAFEKICGSKYMAPLYDPETEKATDAKVCIDQFEFPSIPCAYPVVWIRASEAAQVCQAMGKRMCDAHEWEGACEGKLLPPDYAFDKVQGMSGGAAFNKLRALHNAKWSPKKRWAYGDQRQTGVCAMNSSKDAKCNGGDWKSCGSNTYPTGMFPGCSNELQVYDIHGNAAEHMNLPTKPSEMASHPSSTLGHTEMKGSWFIWDKFQAHADWCRWRAPAWHRTMVMDEKHSHHNYHLGFRCCSDVTAATSPMPRGKDKEKPSSKDKTKTKKKEKEKEKVKK